MSAPPALSIDGERLWATITASAAIGVGRRPTGLQRLALTDADRDMRDLFVRWCREAGCAVSVDRMGSIFARREGTDPSLPPVLVGSHLDTQIAGGRYDGIAGVLAGLEILRTLNDAGIRTRRAVELVDWTNEEGARFYPPMMASAVFAGVRPLEWALARRDPDGKTVGEELERIGYAGPAPVGGRPVDAYFELHIEQGPILDAKGIPVGVVSGTYEVRGMNVVVRGETAHAGPTLMADRRSAMVGAAMLIVAVNEIGWTYAPDGKSTTSRIEVWPNLPGIISDWAQVTIDVRHPQGEQVDRMVADVRRAMQECAPRAQVEMEIAETWQFGSERFDPELMALIRRTAAEHGVPNVDLLSQAGHDAYYVSRVAPTAMIFTPCARGISHNEAEHCTLDDLVPGVTVLLHSVLARANR
jgi:beta-ureidopropionase / N-carbamoyl-L-amino-acid hydrolase